MHQSPHFLIDKIYAHDAAESRGYVFPTEIGPRLFMYCEDPNCLQYLLF